MAKKINIYYKLCLLVKKTNKYEFSKTKFRIKQIEFLDIVKAAMKEFAEAEIHSLTRRMGMVYLNEDQYNQVAKLAKLPKQIEPLSENDYVTIFNDFDKMILMLRDFRCEQEDITKFLEWEVQARKQTEAKSRLAIENLPKMKAHNNLAKEREVKEEIATSKVPPELVEAGKAQR